MRSINLERGEQKPKEIYNSKLIADLEIEWRRAGHDFLVNDTLVFRATLLHKLNESFGLTPENAYDAAFHEWMAHLAITPEEKKVRYLKHFEASKEGTIFAFDPQKAADILYETNETYYKDNPEGFVRGVAALHQLVYGIGAEKTSEAMEAAESYGKAIEAVINLDYKLAQKHWEVFYTKLHALIVS